MRQELAGPPELIGDDVAGRAIRLAYADRMRLKITTIGSYDVDRAGRTKRADDREREAGKARKAEERRANGATPRAHSFSQTRP